MIECSGLTARTDSEWIALCPEYDLAASGPTALLALRRLATIIEMTADLARTHRLAIGRAVPEEKVAEFLAGHVGGKQMRARYEIDTDLDPITARMVAVDEFGSVSEAAVEP